jgi:1-deoxy-D-xylulose-5-phosphate synthase
MLTGRRKLFHTNRKLGGISGFPKMDESPYDAFGVGHASTSISAALGMAQAACLKGDNDRRIVAVIGDGAMTGGMVFEAMNNAGMAKANLLVILNDNQMAIDRNVGAINEYLLDITTSQTYNKVKKDVWDMLGKIKRFGPNTQQLIQKIETGIKTVVLRQSNLFEAMNFRYFGPVDGHDVVGLTKILRDLRNIPGPKLLHVLTKKGKGFPQAELNQTAWHSTSGAFDKLTGKLLPVPAPKKKPTSFQEVFGKTMARLAKENENIVAVTPAMPTGSSLTDMMEKLPGRVFDVGIAEPHAVTFSAGLATQGMKPYCSIYSSFMQRAYDQVLHDVALQKLPVVFCLDRGGLVGEDGPTHHGVYDLAYMRTIPGLIVSAPMDGDELRNMLYTAQFVKDRPISIRYPKGKTETYHEEKEFERIPIGKGRQLSRGKHIAILSIGLTGAFAKQTVKSLAKESMHVALYDLRFLKPLDEDLLHEIFRSYTDIITVEDGTLLGGLGSAIAEFATRNRYKNELTSLGVPDSYIEQGTQDELYEICGINSKGIAQRVKEICHSKAYFSEERAMKKDTKKESHYQDK